MRTKSLLTCGLMLVGLVVLFAAATDVALTQEGGVRPRPTVAPDMVPSGYEPAHPMAPDAYPDLVITNLQFVPTEPYVGEGVSVYVTVKNQGNADVGATETFYADLYINPPTDDLRGMIGDYYEGVQGALLDAGESTIVKIPLDSTIVFTDAVSYNLWAQVDTPEWAGLPTGWILESDEDNNIWGPDYVTVRTRQAWVQKDHEDFFRRSMASTLDVVPIDVVDIIPPGLEVEGDSALALGIFDEPPRTTWGSSGNTDDYNMMEPDEQVNEGEDEYQRYPFVHAEGPLVVAVWEDGRWGPTYGKDIFMRYSTNEGQDWESEEQVNEWYDPDGLGPLPANSINDQKHPAVAVSPDGHVVVAWQDHRGDSFDIYVQAFFYDGLNLIRCDPNGDCSANCDPSAGPCNFRVDTDANDEDQILPDIAVDEDNNFYLVWQDQRNGNDDAFSVRSYYDAGDLRWGDDTMVLDFPSTTKQASPAISAVRGPKVTDIACQVLDCGPPPTVVCTVDEEPTTFVAVTWEDWREGDADIYYSYSNDLGETFVIDERLNDDKAVGEPSNGLHQLAPDVAVHQWMREVTLLVPSDCGYDIPVGVDLPVTTMHIVWEDSREGNPDVFYGAITIQPGPEPPYDPILTREGQEKVNQNDERAWQTEPPWQGEPGVAATGSGLTLAESEGYNAFVVWADGRNYGGDFDNLDIYFRLFSNVGAPTQFVGGNNVMVNSNARLHDFDENIYDDYRRDIPPHARQRNPSIASTLIADWPTIFGGYLYVVWDDDRILNPFTDRNIYISRSNLLFGGHGLPFSGPGPGQDPLVPYGAGAHVSEVFDSGAYGTTWYIVDWHGVTDSGTYVTLQTRLGDTRAEVLSSDWYPHVPQQSWPYPDDAVSLGAPLEGYDAPGQHIVDENGDWWPQARYIQYRVNFWARDVATDPSVIMLKTPFLFDVILHYQLPPMAYLPLVFKGYSAP